MINIPGRLTGIWGKESEQNLMFEKQKVVTAIAFEYNTVIYPKSSESEVEEETPEVVEFELNFLE